MPTVNDRLLEIKYKINERERLKGLLYRLVDIQKELEAKKLNLGQQLKKEEFDVEKLQGISITGFLHMLKGDREERLEKEKSEVLTVKLKYDSVCTELEETSKQIWQTSTVISGYQGIDKEYEEVIKEKEKYMTSGTPESSRINEIIEEQAGLKSRQKEVDEALYAGDRLLNSLDKVSESLQSAHNWGVWDMFGGGFLSTAAKHSSIDEAKKEIDNTQSLLRRFHNELRDVGGEVEIKIEIGSFLTFADYFFDGLFADSAVQGRIDDAQYKVKDTISTVKTVLLKLKEESDYMKRKIDRLEKERLEIVEKA
ncbi:hypothetical protein OXPF_18210 [Oxobacter pfennigii]|uniref:Uncharacterized protein n=1 Tax=Oxobacter pfennigii TaxID=36849 RepID=A0A0P8WAJ6_9CLOT|nr:hypothetical protein [Oxobacter pfennigii]KPU44735.1 hypothetical protein OXPF_18210 [Oxobacter pfennigii]